MATVIVPISLLNPLYSRGHNVDSTNLTIGVSDVASAAYYKSLVKFNFGVLPNGAKIKSAKLVMTGYASSNPTNFYIARNTSDFTTSTTYHTAPGVTSATLFSPATAMNQKVTYDLTGILDFNNIENNAFGLAMYVTDLNVYGYGHYYGTGTNAPYIEVTYNEAPTNSNQIPTTNTKKGINSSIVLTNYFKDTDGDFLTFNATSSNTNIVRVTVSGSELTITGVALGTATITVTASDGQLTTSQSFTVNVTNTIPTVSVTAPNTNVTLYENDMLNIAGSAADTDANQSVTVYAQINLEQRIVLAVGLSNAPIPYSKQLKFKGGQLYDGDTVITSKLADGVPHTLKIWAQDGDGGQSTIVERTFYVVPNRPPVLTVDTVQPSGIINTDKFVISGTAGDPDGNPVTAVYRVNGGNSIALEITEGRWAFDISLAQLVVGQNTIIVELVDSYNFKVSKTIKLNKNEVETPILQSVARYKIEPPRGSAKGVLLWVQRDVDLDALSVELSMTLQGEQEQYISLTPTNTAPVSEGIVEDEFYYEATEAKNNIILKLSTTRPNINIDHKIHLISGVLE